MLRCRGILFNFEFWGGEQNFVPNMWQVVFAHISVESRVVHSNVDGLLDGSGDAMTLSFNNLKGFPLMFCGQLCHHVHRLVMVLLSVL